MTTSFGTRTPYVQVLEICSDKPHQVHEHLNVAVDRAIAHAIKIGSYGVLVTQHSYRLYSVSLNTDVPYGQIREHSLATRESS